MSETTGRNAIRAELGGPLVLLLVLVPLLAFAGFALDASIVGAQAHQREIRTAQMLRARVLRFQLDEQTGLRGFEVTGDRRFLEPFAKARAPFDKSISALEASATRLDLGDVVTLTERQRTRGNARR